MENFDEVRFKESKKYILNLVKCTNYVQGHPFKNIEFEQSYDFIILSFIKYYSVETEMIRDYITRKLNGKKNNKFNYEIFNQQMSELLFYYYLLTGIMQSYYTKKLIGYEYEPSSPSKDEKKLEYSFIFGNREENKIEWKVNFEVKTMTCDPYYKEGTLPIKPNSKLIKKYFNDTELENYFSPSELKDFISLEKCSHKRQIVKQIRLIKEKYEEESKNQYMINIGVIVIHFATSIEEFYAYLFHPKKGIMNNCDVGNIDALVFFSITAKPDIFMEDIIQKNHTFTLQFNNNELTTKVLKMFRVHNTVYLKGQIRNDIKEFINVEYGIIKVVMEEGFYFYVPDGTSEEQIASYIRHLKE